MKICSSAISKGYKIIYKINNFSIVTSICPKYRCTQSSCPKIVVEKFSSSELKIEKVKWFTQRLTKFYCISVFNVGVCLAGCLTFGPFITLD